MIRRNPRYRRPSWLDFFDDCRKTRRQLEEQERQRQVRSHLGVCYVVPEWPPPPPVAAEGCCRHWSGDYKDRCCSIWDSRQAEVLFPREPESLTVTCSNIGWRWFRPPVLCLRIDQWQVAPGGQLTLFPSPPTLQGTP